MGERISPGAADGKAEAVGAYGLRVDGLPDAGRWMAPVAAAGAFTVELVIAPVPDDPPPSTVTGEHADLRLLGGGRLLMRRGDGRAEFSFAAPPPSQAELLHPYLAPAAALAQIWAGAEAFHAAALVAPAGAVLMIGGKEAGKSTTLAWLAREARAPVLADDLAVVVAGEILAGPRCLDVRASDAYHPGPDADAVRGDGRLRLSLAAAPAAVPLAGVAVLRWGEAVAVQAVPARERLGELLGQRMYRALLAADLAAVLDLAAVPMVTVTRPRGRRGLEGAGTALLAYFA